MNSHSSIPIGALNRSSPQQKGGAAASNAPTIGAALTPVRAFGPDGAADASNRSTIPCDECNGAGEICWVRHHPDDPRADRWAVCHYCDGTGEVDVTCDCGSPLDDRGWCADCEAFDVEPQCTQCGALLEEVPCADCVSNVTDYPRLTSFPGGASLTMEQVNERIARFFDLDVKVRADGSAGVEL